MYAIEASFAFPEQHPMTYWWPLLCEAMRCQGLAFDNPHYLPAHLGDYHFQYAVDKQRFGYDVDSDVKHEKSFRQLWDDLHDERCRGVLVNFWSVLQPVVGAEGKTEPELDLEGLLHQDSETQTVTLSCYLPYLGEGVEKTPEAGTREATRRVHRWLEVIREIYRLCSPCTAELTHERYGYEYRMGTIGKPLVLEWWDSPSKPMPYEGDIVQERLPDGSVLSVVTPLRLPWRGDAIPITLHGGQMTQAQDRAEKL